MLSLFVFSCLFVFGFFAGSEGVEAQPWGGTGWCPPTGCEGSMNVSGPFGTCPGNLTTCPVSGQGCMMGQSGTCCAQSTAQEAGLYSYVCGGSGGGPGNDSPSCNTSIPDLSYSCNATGTQATLSITASTGGARALRINDPTTPWTGACPAASPDFCGFITGNTYSMNNIVPGRTYSVWAHSMIECGGYIIGINPTPGSINVTCYPSPPPAPALTFTADSYSLPANGSTTLRWTSQNATSCTASRSPVGGTWTGSKAFNGTYLEGTGSLASGSYDYTLRCDGASGTSPITRSFNISVALPPLPPPIDPTGLTATCLAPDRVRLSWNPVATASVYPLRVNDLTNVTSSGTSWDGSCTAPDQCVDIFGTSYERTVVVGRDYGWWVHAVNASGWSPGIHGPNFRCDYPASTIRGRITNQATGAGIPGVVIPVCAANPGATTDASGNYSFTVPYDARFCIRPSTPVGLSANPLLSGLQPSQRVSTHTYEWQVAGWNAGVHPSCDNSSVAPCDEWKQWDRSVDTGYDFIYSSLPLPTATLSLNPNPVNIHSTAGTPTVRATWSSTDATSCVATSGNGFNTGNATSGANVVIPTPGAVGSYLYSVRCDGPGGSVVASQNLTAVSICNPTTTCTASDICEGKSCNDGCGNVTPGTKDCRKFWKEVAP